MMCVLGTGNHRYRAEEMQDRSLQRGLGFSTPGVMHDLQSRLWARVTGRVMQGQGGTAVRTVHGVRS
jgi:hypothetical protein